MFDAKPGDWLQFSGALLGALLGAGVAISLGSQSGLESGAWMPAKSADLKQNSSRSYPSRSAISSTRQRQSSDLEKQLLEIPKN